MSTSTITGTITDGSGAAVSSVTVYARLRPGPASRLSDGSSVANPASTTTNGSGVYSFALERQANIVPAGSWWEIEEDTPDASGGRRVRTINVGNTNATVQQSEVTPLALLGPTALTQAQGDARYLAQGSLFTSVKNATYGAAGDGTTNDTAAVQAAITAVGNGGGGTVFFPPGTYMISAFLSSTANNVRLLGSGTASIIKAANAMNATLADLRGQNVAVENLVFDGNGSNQTPNTGAYKGLYMTACTKVLLRNVTLQNCNASGLLIDNSGGAWSDVRVESCIAQNNGNATVISGPNSAQVGNGLTFVAGGRATVIGNICQNNVGDGIYTQSLNDSTVTANISETNGGYGIELTTSITGCTFTANVCRNNSESGIGADGIAVMGGNTIASNVCDGNGGAGIQVDAGSGTPANNVIVGNVCRNNSAPNLARTDNGVAGTLTTANSRDGIEMSGAKSTTIVANQCYDDQVTKSQRNAMSDGGGAPNHLVAGNYFPDNRTAGMVLTGSGNVVGLNRLTSGGAGVLSTGVAATTLGTVVKKIQVFDSTGTSLGYLPVYDAIT